MENILKSKDLKVALYFSAIGLAAGIFVGIYQIPMLSEEIKRQIIGQYGTTNAIIAISAVQSTVYAFLSAFFGLKIARKVNLKLNFKFDKSALLLATLIGFVVAIIITGSDKFIFAVYLPPQITAYVFSPVYLMTGILYGGIIEELMLRLLVMSLLVLVIRKLFTRSKDSLNIPGWIYITAIVLSAMMFAAGHLPNTAQILGLSAPILIRCFILNGIGGIGFGYLYWKKGLAYSMYAHGAAHFFMQVILIPILF